MVAALASEARCLGSFQRDSPGVTGRPLARLADGSLLCVSGVGAAAAGEAARALVAAGAAALLSWGVAGALDPRLRCGSIVLPGEVLQAAAAAASAERFLTDAAWRQRLVRALHAEAPLSPAPSSPVTLLSSDAPVARAAHKAQYFRATQAAAVDMESAAVAAVAARHGLPFMAVRVIVDTALDSVPDSVLRLLEQRHAGHSAPPSLWALLWPLLRAPRDWAALLHLAGRYRGAQRALRRCARLGEPTRRCDLPAGH